MASLLAALAGAAALGTAFAAQYWGGLAPCPLCIVQRYPYAAVIVLGALGYMTVAGQAARWILPAITLAFAIGTGVALYHAGIEQKWWHGPAACTASFAPPATIEELRALIEAAPIVRCDEIPWAFFGFSLAGLNFLAGLALTGFSAIAWRRGAAKAGDEKGARR